MDTACLTSVWTIPLLLHLRRLIGRRGRALGGISFASGAPGIPWRTRVAVKWPIDRSAHRIAKALGIALFVWWPMDVPAVQNGTPVKDPAIISIRACAGLQCQAFTGIRVAPDYVLTAAHAAVGKNVFMLDGENISKENVYIHPSFSPDQVHNSFDLALIRVSRKANKIIQIYGQEVSGEVSIRGYGCDEHGNFGDLRSGETVIVPRQILSQDILDLMGPVGEDEYTYVTVGNNKGAYSGMCRGDSGGPILKKIKNRRYLVGVNSFYDFDEAGMTNFSAHTRLFRVLDWIASFGIKVKSSAG